MPDNDSAFFDSIDFNIRFEHDHVKNIMRLTPVFQFFSERAATLIAAFRIDGMEMIECERISISEGWNEAPFRQPVRIHDPRCWNPSGRGEQSMYEMSVVFYKNGRAHYVVNKMTGIRHAALTIRGRLRVNDDELIRRRIEVGENVSEKELDDLRARPDAGMAVIQASHSRLHAILELFDRTGIPAAVELKDECEAALDAIAMHPSVCLLAKQGTGSGRHRTGLPFVSPEYMDDIFSL